MRVAELGRVAPEQTRDSAEPKHIDVLADDRATLRGILDEQCETRAARNGFNAKRARAGKKIQDARVRRSGRCIHG